MTAQELKDYTEVKDNNKPVYVLLVIIIVAIVLGFVFAEKPSSYFNFYYLSLLLLFPMFQAFRNRTCATCNTSMKRFYWALFPNYYYCEKCKTKIRVDVIVVG